MTLKIKDFCTYEQQLDILRRRGLIIHDEAIALRHLREKNYYRLSAYSLTLRSYNPCSGEDHFHAGASFDDIVELYDFDEQFRSVVLSACTIVETNLKAYVAYYHSQKYGPTGYLNNKNFEVPWNHAKLLMRFQNLCICARMSRLSFIITMI